jgi:adenylate cyclase
MPHVALIYCDEKKGAAARLREAIVAAGYSVGTDGTHAADAAAQGAVGDKLAAAAAILVIWSRAAMESELVATIAEEARREGKLIEVSTDGIMPAESARTGRTALLSGWRGEPYHPGWRAIADRLRQLCGDSRATDGPLRTRAPEEPDGGTGAERGRRRPPRGAGLALLLFLTGAAIGIAAWLRDGG